MFRASCATTAMVAGRGREPGTAEAPGHRHGHQPGGGGYVDGGGRITGWLNELAFLPVDLHPAAPVDRSWSGDRGVGDRYFSQEGVIRLAAQCGLAPEWRHPGAEIALDPGSSGSRRWPGIGGIFYLGAHAGADPALVSALAWVRQMCCFLGRVVDGAGGECLVNACRAELAKTGEGMEIFLPEESFRRVGQAAAAAMLEAAAE